jgi:conjugative relaxase-like TrwC/TraI family protein
MAASHKKITIGAGQSAADAVAYLANPQATGDYYSESDHAFMRWIASDHARAVLGLDDRVALWKLERLLNGQHPSTGRSIRRWGPDGTMVGAHDVTISPAPKSVSILWALADPELREEIELLVGQAAAVAIDRMLRRVPLMRERYGPGGKDVRHVKVDDYVGVQALHTTARISEAKPNVPDPDLHVHTLLMGAVDAKGNLRALDSLKIKQYRSELGAYASGWLAEQLRLRGWPIERSLATSTRGKTTASWEIQGVPAELIKAMSSRRVEIEKLKRDYRELFGREAEGTHFERFLLNHRGPKSKRSADELHTEWANEGREHSYGPEAVTLAKAEASVRKAAGVTERDEYGPEAAQLRQEILADLTREHALVPKRELDKLAQERGMGLVEPAIAGLVVAEMFGDGDLLMTTDGQKVTTLETLAAEQRAIEAAGQLLQAPHRPAVDPERLEAEFREQEEKGRPFDEGQRQAIALATSGARFVSIAGPAGTGKGYASHAMVDLWHEQGRRVIALAVAGRTSQQAQVDSGADLEYNLTRLDAKLKAGSLSLTRNDVLLVDEGGMVDHHRYVPLLEAAVQSGATLVQIGDDKQLSPVEAGGLWTVTHQMAAEYDVATELREIHRARNPAEAEAWTQIRHGDIEKGLLWFRDESRLHLYDTRPELLHCLVNEWWATDPTGVMVVDTSNAERDSVNRIAQAKRLEAGELGAEVLQLANGREVRTGERVLFSEIHDFRDDGRSTSPRRVENGTPATVLGLHAEPEGGYSLLDSERASAAKRAPLNRAVVALHEPAGDRIVTVDAKAPLELGYARHVYKAQGMTAEVANIATGPSTTQERLYVMVSRSREGTRIHALRSEVEEMGAEPAHLEPQQGARVEPVRAGQVAAPEAQASSVEAAASEPTPATGIRAGMTAADLNAQIEASRADREANAEYATIREISHHARSEAKQAAAPATWSPPPEPHAGERQVRLADRDADPNVAAHYGEDFAQRNQPPEHVHDRATSAVMRHTLGFEEIRAATRQRLQERLETVAQEVQQEQKARARIPESMPARTAAESVARMHAERGNTTEALALYRTLGRLDFADHPEQAAVERASQTPGSLIVAQDQAQRDRLLGLLNERQLAEHAEHEATYGRQPAPPERPPVVLAQDLYRQRTEQREQWAARVRDSQRESGRDPEAFQHHIEPGAADKALAVVNTPKDAHSLSRGVSGAAEAHVITGQPDWLTSEAVRLRADQLTIAQEARAQEANQRQSAEAAQHLEQQVVEHSATRAAEHAAEHSAQPSAEPAGAER